MRMILWHNMIVHLLAMLIVAAHTLEEARLAPEYSYREESCLDLMPSQMTEANMSSQAGENAPFHAKIMYDNETTFTYKPNHEYRSECKTSHQLHRLYLVKPGTCILRSNYIHKFQSRKLHVTVAIGRILLSYSHVTKTLAVIADLHAVFSLYTIFIWYIFSYHIK